MTNTKTDQKDSRFTGKRLNPSVANGKQLRREVKALLSDAGEHLPEEFRPRLRDVSDLFFDHRREVGRLRDTLTSTERHVEQLREAIAEHERESERGKADLNANKERVDQLAKDLAAKQAEIGSIRSELRLFDDLRLQVNFTLGCRTDELLQVLGDTALGHRKLSVASVRRSEEVESRLASGDLTEEQISKLVTRAVGYFAAQFVPDDCFYELYPLGMAALIRKDSQEPEALHITVRTLSRNKQDYSKDFSEDVLWLWLAVNGASCVSSEVPFPGNVSVSPTPEHLIGFRTKPELMEAQHLLLNASMDEVNEFMKTTIPRMIETGDVRYIKPEAPEPPTDGTTEWSQGGYRWATGPSNAHSWLRPYTNRFFESK
jgi:hypothetical protein